MLKSVSFSLIILTLLSISTFAQNDQTLKRKYAVWFGSRMLKVESLPNTSQIDFMNYPETQDQFLKSFYLGFTGHFWLTEKWEFDMKAILRQGLIPNNFIVSAQYSPVRNFGFNMGLYAFPVYFSQFFTYHLQEDQPYILDTLHINNLSGIYTDAAFIAGPVFSIDHRHASVIFKLNGGISSFLPFEESIFMKRINSNERRRIIYNSKISPALLFMPELELAINLFKTRKATLGIQFQGNAIVSKRAIHYTKTTHTWLWGEAVGEKVKNPTHKYQMFNIDAGIFWRIQ
jgi:hypothetical protein